MDQSARLTALAAEYAPKRDLYELLGVEAFTADTDQIRKAWRRTGLKYHPDKAGDKFDKELYETYQHARDILTDDEARKKYDGLRRALLQKQLELEAMSAGRRRMIEDLEAAEAAAKRQRTGQPPDHPDDGDGPALTPRERAERERQQQENKQKFQEYKENLRAEQRRQEAETDAKLDAREAEIRQKLKEIAERKAAKARRKGRKGDGDSGLDQKANDRDSVDTDTPMHTASDPASPAIPADPPADAEGGARDPLISEDEARSFKFTKVQLMIHQTARDIEAAVDELKSARDSLGTELGLDKLEGLITTVRETDVYSFEALGKPIPPRLLEFCALWRPARTTGRGDITQVKQMMQQTAEDIQAQATEYGRVYAWAPSAALGLAKLQKALDSIQKADIYLYEALGQQLPPRLSSCDSKWERPGHPSWRGGWEGKKKKSRKD
ncbi:hypothetical protein GGTG_03927 [Gaeumannomyces tritici R3-111a-1]|uniref:J domain-containing protein n=1 Tax=Gaeumannomyces tritici (strain R3-111a-1) TaxID=644352 RepID=J3NRM5_GAET3|nr:hypothetical protein GGTG_03927 [Gaeumannomyces tritici R3-111a-1]EJT78831.1 hypothetical protein GGTG_03927 [Gaeumannomyces tritici R3-111a-1]